MNPRVGGANAGKRHGYGLAWFTVFGRGSGKGRVGRMIHPKDPEAGTAGDCG